MALDMITGEYHLATLALYLKLEPNALAQMTIGDLHTVIKSKITSENEAAAQPKQENAATQDVGK